MKELSCVAAVCSAVLVAAAGDGVAKKVDALPEAVWKQSEWISAKDANVLDEKGREGWLAAPGAASYFRKKIVNAKAVKRARWMTSGLGVYEIAVNGRIAGDEILKPGFTSARKTRLSFTYDITAMLNAAAGAENTFSATATSGWWSDKVAAFAGKKPAFRGVIFLEYADGTSESIPTRHDTWSGSAKGPIAFSGIYDGEGYDARVAEPVFADGESCEKNTEFKGKVVPSTGAETYRREDLVLEPVEAYVWKGVDGKEKEGRKTVKHGVVKKTRTYGKGDRISLEPGETLVVDFAQNSSAVPEFKFSAAEGVTVTCLPAEMLNDMNGETSRGNDGPAGSVYRRNLRMSGGMKMEYTFGKSSGPVVHSPRFTFFGYRYISITATGKVDIHSIRSIPVTSVTKAMESGSLETGRADVNRLVANTYWGQLSNYLSVPTDCPQRNERLGWTADTQVFAETGSYLADTRSFFAKWMRDMRDSQHRDGAYPSVAPSGPYGGNHRRLGWGDAGVIVPFTVWHHYGDKSIIDANWSSMTRYMNMIEGADNWGGGSQYADWLSFESYEAHKKRVPETEGYWKYLGACYWLLDARMMGEMAAATGRKDDVAKYAKLAEKIAADIKAKWFSSPDGMISSEYRHMQTPALFALKLGLVEGEARKRTIDALAENFRKRGNCLSTGFLGTAILMDVLTEAGLTDLAYDVLLNHGFPGWLYSVDQGATTIWERWNSYTREKGFGDAGMNSFNHYAYGAVTAWMFKTMAGIQTGPEAGWDKFVLAPQPDRRLGFCKASFRTPNGGEIKSHWRFEGDEWIWEFTVPKGSVATVSIPGEQGAPKTYTSGEYRISKKM